MLAVVFDHLFRWPSGGFIGVDIFFVISGFLITGLLLREYEAKGRIDFVAFYRRRIRRIVPAAFLTLLVTTVVAALIFTSGRVRSIFFDAIAGFFSFANWHFAISGADYFQWGSAPSPLQHFWSLSVEEQFYFVWPALLIAVLVPATILTRRGRGLTNWGTISVRIVLIVIVAASFAWAMSESVANPTVAYFSTFSRVWELAIGALLAACSAFFFRLPDLVRVLMAYAGLIGISASLFLIDSASIFPAPSALLPVLSTAMVIASGIGREPGRLWVLTNPLARYVGDISYSLYLWHFPVIVLLGAFLPTTSRSYVVIAVVLMFVFAIASYRLVEQPLNKSPFLERFSNPSERRASFAAWRGQWGPKVRVGFAMFLVGMLGAVGLIVVSDKVFGLTSTTQSIEAVPAEFVNDPTISPGRQALASQVVEALNASEWPTLTPSSGEVLAEGAPEEDTLGCAKTDIANPSSCAFGSEEMPAMVVFGDSTGITLLPTVRAAYGDDHFIRGLTMASCPVTGLQVPHDSAQREADCVQHREQSFAEVDRLKPQVVFVTQNYEWASSERLLSGASGDALRAEWAEAAAKTAERLAQSAGAVVFVTPPPEGKVLADCATALSTPIDCVSVVPETWNTALAAETSIVEGAVHVVDTSEWFCSQTDRCPAFVDGTPTKRDYVHTTKQWAVKMAPLFKETVDPLRADGQN